MPPPKFFCPNNDSFLPGRFNLISPDLLRVGDLVHTGLKSGLGRVRRVGPAKSSLVSEGCVRAEITLVDAHGVARPEGDAVIGIFHPWVQIARLDAVG